MGVPMNYGECDGGPWHKKHMAHPEPTFPVWIDPATKKTWPAQVAPTKTRPGELGQYDWSTETSKWHWKPPAAASSRG